MHYEVFQILNIEVDMISYFKLWHIAKEIRSISHRKNRNNIFETFPWLRASYHVTGHQLIKDEQLPMHNAPFGASRHCNIKKILQHFNMYNELQ